MLEILGGMPTWLPWLRLWLQEKNENERTAFVRLIAP